MLATIVLTTLALLLLLIFGLLFPRKVFLGPRATRERVMMAYGVPAFVGFLMITALAPRESAPPLSDQAKEPATAPAQEPAEELAQEPAKELAQEPAKELAQEPAKELAQEPATEPRRAAATEKVGMPSISFHGITLPGRMSEAKAAGFTDCRVGHDSYVCRSTRPVQLLGLTTNGATLELDGKNHFQTPNFPYAPVGQDVRMLPAEALAYGSVTLGFPESEYDPSCMSELRAKRRHQEKSSTCILNKNSYGHLPQALLDAGWLKVRDRESGSEMYVHPQELVKIRLGLGGMSVSPLSADMVRQRVAEYEQARANVDAVNANARKVIEEMKR